MDGSPDKIPYEVTISLKRERLMHTKAKGADDGCGGEHDVTIDLNAEGLHQDGDCLDDDVLAALQKLHEAAHPDGAVYIQNCLEPVCADAVGALSWDH